MLLVSHKVVFIENEAVLLCVTMRKCARAFASTIYCVTIWYSFCHYKVQFSWCTFQTHFGMGMRHFQKIVLTTKLFLSLQSFIGHIANISFGYIRNKICHSCRSRVDCVALVLYLCCAHVADVSLVSHSYRLWHICVARVWHLCCKIE